MVSVEGLRRYGNLPGNVPDEVLLPHLRDAEEKVKTLTGLNDLSGLESAVYAFALAEIVRVVDVAVGISQELLKGVMEADVQLAGAADVARLSRAWRKRGYEILRVKGLLRPGVEVI